LEDGGIIYLARRSFPWPGNAGVITSLIHVSKSNTRIPRILDGVPVSVITSYLDESENITPNKLIPSVPYSQGQVLNGKGFILDFEEGNQLRQSDSKYKDVVKPYVNGDIFNSTSDQAPVKWAIDFGVRNLNESRAYKEPFKIVEDRVKPKREGITRQVHEERFWLYWDKREKFLESASSRNRILVAALVTKFLSFRFYEPTWVFSHALELFDIQNFSTFAIMQSCVLECWARQHSSTLGETLRFSMSDAFETFPFCQSDSVDVGDVGKGYYNHREVILREMKVGLTGCWNMVCDPKWDDSRIVQLRKMQRLMDQAVVTAYGWSDIDLDHDFHDTEQGTRYTISESARREVLDRLLALNHQRHAQEVKAGLHVKKGNANRPRKAAGQKDLL